ncbi:DEAD/DEAH box helicase [Plasmodium coatneyi]|uniref:2-methoxy-6-polyprenyl-1,4-benzoquinol methylase, mitochondrial n=1 Tax=Plasmodium coatneyi TaxID=208452 RepID=A0A1B1DV40_9APIC|nr:DEAD/DEAH box helicase [Plasmodium coatneyi]ANQ06643.1 DEAD/DEAH box helicase [Plasmodium coatneyi]
MKALQFCSSLHGGYFREKRLGTLLTTGLKSFSTGSDSFGSSERLYNFGFRKVTEEIKSKLVYNLFSHVSNKYDLMNDLMSLRLHRCWKDQLVRELDLFLKYHSYKMQEEIHKSEAIDEGEESSASHSTCKILDLAGGTGDIAFRILERYKYYLKKMNQGSNFDGEEGHPDKFYARFTPEVIVADVNKDMIEVGKKRAKEKNHERNIKWVIENAENLNSFDDNSVDIVTLSFGIRNFTNIPKSLKEIHRVLKPGGRFLCLEFCRVNCSVLKPFYNAYLMNIIPLLGKIVASSEDSYKYLAESIQTFLTPDELSQLMHQNSFRNISYSTMTMGIVAIHSAYKVN